MRFGVLEGFSDPCATPRARAVFPFNRRSIDGRISAPGATWRLWRRWANHGGSREGASATEAERRTPTNVRAVLGREGTRLWLRTQCSPASFRLESHGLGTSPYERSPGRRRALWRSVYCHDKVAVTSPAQVYIDFPMFARGFSVARNCPGAAWRRGQMRDRQTTKHISGKLLLGITSWIQIRTLCASPRPERSTGRFSSPRLLFTNLGRITAVTGGGATV